MSKKSSSLRLGIVLMIILAIGIAVLVLPVQASLEQSQPNSGMVEPACNSCHDNLYYNYDMGKAYCVGSARTRCVDCHDGDPTAFDKAAAHTNLVAYPVINGDDSRCQGCHQADSAARVERFAEIAGFRQMQNITNAAYNFTPQAPSTAAPALHTIEDMTWQTKLLISLTTILIFAGGFLVSRLFHH